MHIASGGNSFIYHEDDLGKKSVTLVIASKVSISVLIN